MRVVHAQSRVHNYNACNRMEGEQMDERKCPRCGEIRPAVMFYSTGNQKWCRYCHRAYYEDRRADRQAYCDRVKMRRGCADCGIRSDHPEIYDFDHMPGAAKTKPVSAFLTSGTFDDLVAEVAKCEVVCANCHRIRTRARGHNAFGKDRVA